MFRLGTWTFNLKSSILKLWIKCGIGEGKTLRAVGSGTFDRKSNNNWLSSRVVVLESVSGSSQKNMFRWGSSYLLEEWKTFFHFIRTWRWIDGCASNPSGVTKETDLWLCEKLGSLIALYSIWLNYYLFTYCPKIQIYLTGLYNLYACDMPGRGETISREARDPSPRMAWRAIEFN